jgi:hypothetical protein
MTDSEAQQRLAQLTPSSAAPQSVYAAAELGIADLIAAGTTTLEGLARATATRPEALFRVLRLLVSLEVFDLADGVYGLTPMGQLLRSDGEGSRRAGICMSARFSRAWTELPHSLRTGQSGFSKAFGQSMFDYLADRPDEGAMFDALMTGVHGSESGPISAAYDFASFGRVLDIGGGNGSLLIEILRDRPGLEGIVFDRPDVAERARGHIAAAGLEGRCQVVGGNFFESVPEGADCHVLRHIVHDWYDAEALTILGSCRRALPEGGRILVAEAIVPDDNSASIAKTFDVAMLVLAGGMERTEAEYRALFERAGLSVSRIVPTDSPVSLIEGRVTS